jgi:hypothetical protein
VSANTVSGILHPEAILIRRCGETGLPEESIAPGLSDPDHGLDRIADIGEIARRPAVIVKLDGSACMMASANLKNAMSGRPHSP